MKKLKIGSKVVGVIVRHEIFGFFVEVDQSPSIGLVELPNMIFKDRDKRITPSDYPNIGSTSLFEVLGYREITNEIWLKWEE